MGTLGYTMIALVIFVYVFFFFLFKSRHRKQPRLSDRSPHPWYWRRF